MLAEALEAACTIIDEEARTNYLATLAPRLPPHQKQVALAEMLAATPAIRNERERAEAFAALAVQLSDGPRRNALHEILDCIPFISRSQAFSILSGLLQLSADEGGACAIQEIRRAINDVCKWYP